ncbi:hypothetical protein ACP275_13G047000 [Erythranthe tilingii]
MNDDKSRTKAMQISVGISGVESAAITGQERDRVEVVGDDVDAVELTRQLRKNVAYAELVSVGEAKKEAPATAAVVAPAPQPAVVWTSYDGFPQYPIYEMRSPSYEPSCTIM